MGGICAYASFAYLNMILPPVLIELFRLYVDGCVTLGCITFVEEVVSIGRITRIGVK